MIILNENNKPIDYSRVENTEQTLAQKYVLPSDAVLELGARYGSVSCVVNKILHNKRNHVVVEPDDRVWEILETNKLNNNCDFNIVKGCISNYKMAVSYPIQKKPIVQQYATVFDVSDHATTPSYTLQDIQHTFNITSFISIIIIQ